ncbi:Lpg1974 family pore-forming outer membrane protein [Devosia aurantiaca]|uniref:Lpg1974 family pore-forming outer membrane protein n=1 Tax=Devosia aurantiaca TaxID=2714858 RepID=UPI002E281274|nr:Lpg1974 family pore-forming outer membrane protein [Devosia aurantiaca]
MGYTPELDDNLDIRLFAGARGLHAANDIFVTEDKLGGEFDESTLIESNYFGIGPRVGMDIANRFADSPFGISGSFAGAVIFGNSSQTITTDTSGGPTSTEIDDNRTVVNLEASIGLDYHFTEQASFTIGYRGEHFGNVSNVPGGEPESFTSHGPFVKAALSF